MSILYFCINVRQMIGVRSPAEAKDFFSNLCPDRLWGPPSLMYSGYRGSFPWDKARSRRDADHSPHLVPMSRMSRRKPLPPSATMACSGTALLFYCLCHQGNDAPLKRRSVSARLHGAIFQKMAILLLLPWKPEISFHFFSPILSQIKQDNIEKTQTAL
jgi:hypothetical protein